MNNNADFIKALDISPIVGAVKDENGLCEVLKSDCTVVFILYGNAAEISDVAARVKTANKFAMIHADLIDGLSAKEAAVDFIKKYTVADGIISTKPLLIKRARALGLLSVQRFFMLDSLALENVTRQISADSADAYEILPGVIPKIIKKLCKKTNKPIIAGGLIADKEDVVTALSAGALAVSTTCAKVWSSL